MAIIMKKISFDKNIYELITIQKAAYRSLKNMTVDISVLGSLIVCEISTTSHGYLSLEECVEDFKTEVLDQHLREKIKAETENVRNIIIASAFSRTDLV
jgi:His-Xaa-Ser system protein HxsD